MDFVVNEDQIALAEGVRTLCQGRMSIDSIRQFEGADNVVDQATWKALADAGVFNLTLAQTDGGVGLGLADAAVVFEELGRALVPGPLVGTFLAAGLVHGSAEGEVLVGVTTRIDHTLVPPLIEHLGALDSLLVLPPFDDPVGCVEHVDPATVPGKRIRSLDPLTPLWALSAPIPMGKEVGDHDVAQMQRGRAMVLTAAQQVGHAAACVDLAVDYAKTRHQFGRPIGGFQAIKHLCADMLVRSEVARCAVQSAAVLMDQPDVVAIEAQTLGLSDAGVLRRAVCGAKLLADDAAKANAKGCIQVHGGMGFTWEIPVHLYLKRARTLATSFSSAHELAEQVAELL